MAEPELTDSERRHAAGLMRVNHSGEVCAQGLYQGQALTARLPQVRQSMEQAALEENDHLKWCEERLQELESRLRGRGLPGTGNAPAGDQIVELEVLAPKAHTDAQRKAYAKMRDAFGDDWRRG